jgi:hypothetical protein
VLNPVWSKTEGKILGVYPRPFWPQRWLEVSVANPTVGSPVCGLTCCGESSAMSKPRESKAVDFERSRRLSTGEDARGTGPLEQQAQGLDPRKQACWGNAWGVKPQEVKSPAVNRRRGWVAGITGTCPMGLIPRKWPQPVGGQVPRG